MSEQPRDDPAPSTVQLEYYRPTPMRKNALRELWPFLWDAGKVIALIVTPVAAILTIIGFTTGSTRGATRSAKLTLQQRQAEIDEAVAAEQAHGER